MHRGSHSNPAEKPPEKEDLTILITQFLSPQQFSYVRRKDVEASAALVREMEKVLAKQCTKEKNKTEYLVNQNVIVHYKSVSPPRLLRGVVKRQEDGEYLVWILDYGFTLCCSSLDMWPLPVLLTRSIWDVLDGSLAYIGPRNGSNWSISALRTFDKLLEDTIDLKFEVVCQGQGKQNFGKLLFKTASQREVFQDGAEFLLEGKHACPQPLKDIMLATSFSEAFTFELAEINDPMIEARPRVKNIMQLVASGNPSSHIQMSVNKLLPQLSSEQRPIYSTASFDIVKVLGKSETWSGSSERNLTRPLEQVPKLDKKLDLRTSIQVPNTARFLRSQVSGSNEGCVISALVMPSTVNNQHSEDINAEGGSSETDRDSDYEDAQTPEFCQPIKSPSRSTSPSTSSQESFVTTNKAADEMSSSGDFLSSESVQSDTESLPKELLKSSSVCRDVVQATSIPSSTSHTPYSMLDSVPKSRINHPTLCKDKIDRIYNEILGKKTNVVPIMARDCENTAEPQNIISPSAVLAHSREPVHPVTSLDELPLAKEIRQKMSDLNIHSLLPTQLYSWPHLLNGGSLMLVNSCGKGRTWSYLPVLCSSVFRSMENSGLSRAVKLGPLAIILVDLPSRANALASDCALLMPNSVEPQVLRVVNTHGHSFPDCQMMLLNSCGILVTTPDHLLEVLNHEIAMIDSKRLEYFIFDDFDRLRLTTPQLLDEVLRKLNGMSTCPSMQVVVVAQQWHAKEFEKLLKRMARPLALFGDFLEASMYGGLRLKFTLTESTLKKDLLLKYLAKQKAYKRRTLIYCKYEMELDNLHWILTRAGHECVGFSKAQNQQPHEILLLSDEVDQLKIPVRNIEVLVHFSLPQSWSKFVKRFHVMADQIPNYLTMAPQDKEKKQSLVSYLLLDESNSLEFRRLSEFLRAHGLATDEIPWMSCQPPTDESIPYCPYLLNEGECRISCGKRHDFIPADMPTPGNPLQQPGTVIRCKLYRTYDLGHMAVWPIEYQTKGSTVWIDAPHPVNQWIAAVEMSMGTKRNVHSPCRLHDVCVVYHQGHLKRVKIVDIRPSGQLTVQMMDYGTELLQVKPNQLLQCPEQKFRTLPPLAMDVRLSGVSAGQGKRATDANQWVQEAFGTIKDRQQMQLTVDFAMLNVVYAKEVALMEECPAMRTSVYKLLLRKELVSRGFGQMDSQSVQRLRGMQEQQAEVNGESEANKENIQQATKKAYRPPSSQTEPREHSNVPIIASEGKIPEPMRVAVNRFQIKPALAKGDSDETKDLSSNETTIKCGTPKEDVASISTESESDQPSTSSAAFYKALMQELYTKSPSKKQDTQQFLQSILNGNDDYKETTARRELNMEDAPQAATRGHSTKPVAQSLQFSTISKGAVRPRVKWYQTRSHIELTIEQKVPEYQLWLEDNTLIYMSPTSPPQHCLLPLLREVRLVSEKQHGYYLKVKLAKVGIQTDWPTLLSSVYAQQSSRWLTYDTEQAEEPGPPAGLVMWERYSRQQQLEKEDYSSEDEEFNSDLGEPGVERSDSAGICDDF